MTYNWDCRRTIFHTHQYQQCWDEIPLVPSLDNHLGQDGTLFCRLNLKRKMHSLCRCLELVQQQYSSCIFSLCLNTHMTYNWDCRRTIFHTHQYQQCWDEIPLVPSLDNRLGQDGTLFCRLNPWSNGS